MHYRPVIYLLNYLYVFTQPGCPTIRELYINLSISNYKGSELRTTILC